MNAVAIKECYTASELANMRLPGLPGTKAGIIALADRSQWDCEEVRGRGGLRREYAPPAPVMRAIKEKAAEQLAATVSTGTDLVIKAAPVHGETEAQRQVADARAGILQAINAMMKETGWPLKTCAKKLLVTAREGKASEQLVAMLKMARDGRGRQSADGLPSDRSLIRFVEYQEQNGTLAPKKRNKDMSVPEWAQAFLKAYQRPEKPTIAHAYSEFVKRYPGDAPSIYQVRRWLGKVGNVSRQHGRIGSNEIKSIKPFVRRGFENLLPSDIYTADGHTFDAEVQHPFHGRPFRPEITTVADVATRKVVGWSIGLAESSLAVLDAMRNAVEANGIPAILYVDNGSGYKNQMMTGTATGLMGRIGTEMVHSLPYNSQARGVIERLQHTVWVRAAKALPTFIGKDMDRQAKLTVYKLSRKKGKSGEIETIPHLGWIAFHEFCAQHVAEYNNRPHRSLPKIKCGESGRRRHQTPNEAWQAHIENGWQPHTVSDLEARPLFRPQVLRTVRRGELEVFTNRYFSRDLEEFHGEQLRVGYDIHDPSFVWVYDDEGRLITKAELDGNKHDYMAQSFIDRGRDKREQTRLKRLDAKADEIRAERKGALPIDQPENIVIPGVLNFPREELSARAEAVTVSFKEVETPAPTQAQKITPAEPVWEAPKTPTERWETWKEFDAMPANELGEQQMKWRNAYARSAEFRAFDNQQQFG